MGRFVSFIVVFALVCLSSSSAGATTTRYFKADHLTGATYIALAKDGTYAVTAREHMFVRVEESGRWKMSGSRISFMPKWGVARKSYSAELVSYKGQNFLSLEGDEGPSIPVPMAEVKRQLDEAPKVLPLYVFFEVSSTLYQRETKQTYPFRALGKAP